MRDAVSEPSQPMASVAGNGTSLETARAWERACCLSRLHIVIASVWEDCAVVLIIAAIFGATGVALIAWWAAEQAMMRQRDSNPGELRALFANGGSGLSPETVTRDMTGR